MSVTGPTRPTLTTRELEAMATQVMIWERVSQAAVSVTFLSAQRMRALNRRTFGHDRMTDVITFPLVHHGTTAGDIYICLAAVRAGAKRLRVPLREEETRVLVHGLLHVLGDDHPEGPRRERSTMWRKQEGYVERLINRPRPRKQR